MNVLLAGGSGFVGGELTRRLTARGDTVTIVTRDAQKPREQRDGVRYAEWLPDVAPFDAVVNLAGASVAERRWNEEFKRKLRSSRIETTRRIVDALAASKQRPRVLVNASAVGYYGDRDEEELPESAPPADDFLARLCVDWEAEALRARDHVRVVIVRTGHVLGASGGMLPRLLLPFRLGLGGPFGRGRSWFPWIHVADQCALIEHALDDARVEGALNATAPGRVRNHEFATALGRALARPAVIPLPTFALRILVGELTEALIGSQRCLPRRTQESGFAFRHPALEPALRDVLARG